MNLTFEQAYRKYEEYFQIHFKVRSIDAIVSVFNLYILPFFHSKKLKEINKNDILEFEKMLDNLNCSYTYKKDIYVFLSMFFNFAKRYLDLEHNVASEVGFILKNKNESKKVADVWTSREFKKFIRKVDDQIYKYFFDFLFYSGCRLGEAIALTFKDYKCGIVSIRRTCIKGDRGFNSPKTHSSVRQFRIDLKLRCEIFVLKKYYQKKYSYFDENFYIFGGMKHLSQTTITRKKNEACKKAKVKQIRLHDFRHSHITMLLSRNVPVRAICDRVGHKDANITLNVYAHALKSDNRKMLSLLNLSHLKLF